MLTVNVDSSALGSKLKMTHEALLSTKLWDAVGQALRAETLRCFTEERAPDGTPWAPLSPATIAMRRGGRKGKASSSNVKILQDTGILRGSIMYQSGPGWCSCGTAVRYANKHQFGYFVTARPFIGVSDAFLSRAVNLIKMGARGMF
jgi:phage gpG-like protein